MAPDKLLDSRLPDSTTKRGLCAGEEGVHQASEGDVVAYKAFELSPEKQPFSSSWRFGIITSFDKNSGGLCMAPWPPGANHPMLWDWQVYKTGVLRTVKVCASIAAKAHQGLAVPVAHDSCSSTDQARAVLDFCRHGF
jgi:hypothetical protein